MSKIKEDSQVWIIEISVCSAMSIFVESLVIMGELLS